MKPIEQKIVTQIMKGKTTNEISKTLEIKVKTVKYHLTSIFKQYRVKHSRQLMAKIHKQQLKN